MWKIGEDSAVDEQGGREAGTRAQTERDRQVDIDEEGDIDGQADRECAWEKMRENRERGEEIDRP